MSLAGMSLRDLEYLLAVAEHLAFGRAAQACSVSQPTLSAQIRKLELLLEVEVFERTSRGVLLTSRGAEVMAQARLVVAEARRMFEVAAAGAAPMEGSFRLGIISTLGPYLVPFLLKPLRERFPKLRLLLSEGITRVLQRQVEEGELDAILAAGPLPGSDLTELKLFREEFVLAVPRDHALARVDRVAQADIPTPELILLAEGHCLRDQSLAFCPARIGEDKPELQAASLETLRQMVAAGIGVSFLPQLAVQIGALLDDMVAYRRIDEGGLGRDIALFHRPGYGRIRDARLLRQSIREIVGANSAVRVAATLT
jgi:LysR family hydrogen peroxide-inducible transcriptional activator